MIASDIHTKDKGSILAMEIYRVSFIGHREMDNDREPEPRLTAIKANLAILRV